jgi:hypothetical protein
VLGEAVAPVLDAGPGAVDEALAGWEARRDAECSESYEWTNWVARAEPVGPLEVSLHHHFAHPDHAHQLLDLHSRILRPGDVLTPDLLTS